MSKHQYRDLVGFMPLDAQVEFTRELLKRLIHRAQNPFETTSVEVEWVTMTSGLAKIKQWNSIDEMQSLVKDLELLLKLLKKEQS